MTKTEHKRALGDMKGRPRSPDGIQQVGHAKYAQNNSHDPDCFDVEKALSIRWHDETILAGRRATLLI
jgi:hypothetical protein